MENPYKLMFDTVLDAARTTVAAVVSLLLARTLKLPGFLGADLRHRDYSVHHRSENSGMAALCRDCLGRGASRVGHDVFPSNALVYASAIFLCGALCALLRLRGAYRFAAITLSIILLIEHQRPAWILASHRFVEVSVGIAVALALAELWPSRS